MIMMNPIQLARTDINLLVLFDVVFRERHLGRAAERLNLTTSAISHALARLRRVLNDPLFLRTPRGVVPTTRATDLAEPIADILARVGAVMSSAEPFDARLSRRRFTIGAPDGLAAIFLPALITRVQLQAPRIDLSVRETFAEPGLMSMDRAWNVVCAQLDARAIDVAVIPVAREAPRYISKRLYNTHFVIAARRGHPFLRRPTLDRYCALDHVLVSPIGDPHGFVDAVLAKQKRSRRVAVTVPNFMLALSLLANSDLIAAIPRNLIEVHGKTMGLQCVEPPVPFRTPDPVYAIASRAALLDAGVTWLFGAFDKDMF
jgi:DNA-binding transcriptional LysR family regulator